VLEKRGSITAKSLLRGIFTSLVKNFRLDKLLPANLKYLENGDKRFAPEILQIWKKNWNELNTMTRETERKKMENQTKDLTAYWPCLLQNQNCN